MWYGRVVNRVLNIGDMAYISTLRAKRLGYHDTIKTFPIDNVHAMIKKVSFYSFSETPYTYLPTHIHTHMGARARAHTHTHTHTHTRTYIYIYI